MTSMHHDNIYFLQGLRVDDKVYHHLCTSEGLIDMKPAQESGEAHLWMQQLVKCRHEIWPVTISVSKKVFFLKIPLW